MKIALLQDSLVVTAGAERVFLAMAEEFKEADIHVLAYRPKLVPEQFRNFTIKSHWLSPLVINHQWFKILFPISTYAMENWNLEDYDLIITSSATTAKYARRFNAPHIVYCYYPTRAIWTDSIYFGDKGGLKAWVFKKLLGYFKKRDYAAAQRISHFIAISESSRAAIQKYYDRDADILFCPVDLERFADGLKAEKKDYFLLVSRLEKWKLVDYAIEAFNKTGQPLRVIGAGPEEGQLRAMAKDNITFLGPVDDETLVRSYGEARAIIFTPEIEYGLIPIEAISAGTPVIALGRAGVLETMVGQNDPDGRPATAILFPDPTAACLIDALKQFEATTFKKEDLLKHAEKFSIASFQRSLREKVENFLSS
jgi:glycosyltransferase involved in cell wall biosynthesis